MPNAQVASSHYEPDGVGDGRKILINCYPEANPTDAGRPMRLIGIPGSIDADTGDTITGTIRGAVQTDGHAGGAILINDGTTVRTLDPSGPTWGTLTGTVAGTDRAQWTFSENEGACLSNGSLYVSTGSAIAAASDADWASLLSAHGQSAFSSVSTLGQRLLATYGSRFGFSDALDFNNTTTLSFYTAESHPDGLIAGVVLGREYYLFGTKVIEPWAETGDNDDPFAPILGREIRTGCLCRDGIAEVDNTLFFVANDYTVRRLSEGGSEIVSEPWLVRKLQSATVSSIHARRYQTENHDFYVLNTDVGCYVFDAATGAWHQRKSLNKDVWDWAYIVVKDGVWYAGERSGSRFAQLSRSYDSEYASSASTFGTEIVSEWTAHLPSMGGRKPISTIRFDGIRGRGSARDEFTEGYVSMRISRDNGNTWGNWRSKSSGALGEYRKRLIWRGNGRAREPQIICHFRSNDFAACSGVAVNED